MGEPSVARRASERSPSVVRDRERGVGVQLSILWILTHLPVSLRQGDGSVSIVWITVLLLTKESFLPSYF